MKLKIASFTLFIILFVGAFVYFRFNTSSQAEASVEHAPFNYDEWLNEQAQEEDTRITFSKDMAVVVITELNTNALRYLGYTQLMQPIVSLNDETKAVYFYDQTVIPRHDTGLLVIHDVYSLDTLLNEKVSSTSNNADITLNSLVFPEYPQNKQPVINEERLFLNENIHIETINATGTILVQLGGEDYQVKAGDSIDLGTRHGSSGVASTLSISNLGLWNSHNMKYVISNYS